MNRKSLGGIQFSDYLSRARAKQALPFAGNRLLDIGCGRGEILGLIDKTTTYLGVDISLTNIKKLKEKYPDRDTLLVDVQRDVVPSKEKFDTILALATIEHLDRPQCFLKRFLPLLEEGGRVIITTPSIMGEYIHRFLGFIRFTDRKVSEIHCHIYKLEELKELLRDSGCEIVCAKHFQLGMNLLVVGRRINIRDNRDCCPP